MSIFSKEELRAFLDDAKAQANGLYGDEKKAQKLSRKAFIKWLEEEIAGLKEEIRSIGDLDPALKDQRVARAKEDFHFFRTTYLPHYYRIKVQSDLQRYLADIYRHIVRPKDLGEKYALAAPRGFGKSTDVALAFVLWVVVFNLKRFITIFSDAVELTELEIEAIKAELEENSRLRADFPHACGMGKRWRIGDIVTANDIRIKGFGSGKRVRGIKHGTKRPDLVIIDDLENDENVRSPKQRDKLEEWLDSALDNLGGVDSVMDIVFIGTLLHKDSLLARKLKLAFWHPKVFRALIRYPRRMDLWDNYEHLYRQKSAEAAHRYYLEHKDRMDAGAKLLWDALSLESLMQKRIASKRAFEKEQQNNPGSEFATFDSTTFRTISPTQMPNLAKKFLFTDFKGDSIKGDYFAVVAGGFDKEAKKLYIYYSYRAQIKGIKAINFLVDLYRKERFYLIGGESNGGFYIARDWFKDKCIETLGVIPGLRFVHNRDKKEERIAELEYPLNPNDPDIIFVGEHPELFRELDDFPEAQNDDLSDALAGLWRLVRLKRTSTKRRAKRFKKRSRFDGYL